jgi:TPR repeat protein
MIIKNNIKYFALFILFVCSCLAVQAQGTLDKLKFEEAEQKYLNKDYSGAITLLEELEQKGLKNPRTLHLKIMAVSKHHAPGYDIVVQFKKDVDYYLKNYDIEGLEDKYKDVYEVSKTLSDKKYDEGILAEKIAQIYYNAKDYKNAMQWYLKAGNYAEYINPKLFNRIGEMYFVGQGVEKDYKKAFEWYTKSATQGNAIGQANLGNMYHNGLGVEKDFTKAIEWYEKAANQGDAYSQNRLGIMYSAEKD